MNAMIDGEYPENITKLTEKQKQCLRLVNNLYTSKEIATQLGKSPHTVDNHLKAALRAVGSTSRLEVARWLATYENEQTRDWSDQAPAVDTDRDLGSAPLSPLVDVEPEPRNDAENPRLDTFPVSSGGAFPSQGGMENDSGSQTNPSGFFLRRFVGGLLGKSRVGFRGDDHPRIRSNFDAENEFHNSGYVSSRSNIAVSQHSDPAKLSGSRRGGSAYVLSQSQKILIILISAFALMIVMVACLTILDELSRLCSHSGLCTWPMKSG